MSGDNDRHRKTLETAARTLAVLLQDAILAPPTEMHEERLPHPFSNMTRADWAECIRLWRHHAPALLAATPSRDCPACGAESATFLFESYDGHPYVECDSCRCWYVNRIVDRALYERYFALEPAARRFGDYTLAQSEVTAAAEADRDRFEKYYRELTTLSGAAPASLSTLDIGCGVGNSLTFAAELGILAHGLEVNASAVAAARANGLTVHYSFAALPKRQYDLITFWESLEHMADPLSALEEARARLAPGGVVAISVPNLTSPALRGFRSDSLHILGGPAWPGHINLFDKETLSTLLGRADLELFDATGQYTLHLPEAIAYALGHWSGARDYLAHETAIARLPHIAHEATQAFGPLVAAMEEAFAMGPILRVFAKVRGANDPPGLENVRRERAARLIAGLEDRYGSAPDDEVAARRGARLRVDTDYADPGFVTEAYVARYSGVAPAPLAYLWRSQPLRLLAGDFIRVRGRLYAGSVMIGLQEEDDWVTVADARSPDAFEMELHATADGDYCIVVADNLPGAAPIDLQLDAIEGVGAGFSADPPRRRGVRLRFEGAFADPEFEIDGSSARYAGAPAPSAYLWTSEPVTLAAGDAIRLRGRVYAGRITLGLQIDQAWATTVSLDKEGAFEIEAKAAADGDYVIVIADNHTETAPVDVEFDALERV